MWASFDDFLNEAQAASEASRQPLVNNLLAERKQFPWIEENKATFVYARPGAERVAINIDIVKGDPPFLPMTRLAGTNLFYVTHTFQRDDLLDYLVAVNDPMTPLQTDKNLLDRIKKYWKPDPYNSMGIQTATADVSVLRMPHARPFADWSRMAGANRGNTIEHRINSPALGVVGRKVWVHTPPNYQDSGLMYPLLIIQDGQWAIGPLQVPHIADVLIKHGRMAPVIIAMVQSGTQEERLREYVTTEKYPEFLTKELLPFLQSQYRIDSTNLGIGGASAGAIAAADAALQNPAVYNALIMFSPPLGKGPAQEKLVKYLKRFTEARLLPHRIFQSVGRYETRSRFYIPGAQLSDILSVRTDIQYKFVELGSGHALTSFRAVMPEALAMAYPGWASI